MPFRFSLVANRRVWAGGLLACCAFLLSSGCGPDYKARGVVKGKVTTGKRPLTTGTVMFYGKNGMTASAVIDTEGNYEMSDAPLGECVVTVTVNKLPDYVTHQRPGQPAVPEMKKPPESKDDVPIPAVPASKMPKFAVPIDAKYSSPETSGLKFTVQKGEQTYNIDL
jgi:hypothetical protein